MVNTSLACQFIWGVNFRANAVFTIFALYLTLVCTKFALSKFGVNPIFSYSDHDIPCNIRLLFYNSIYSVYSWFFLINLLKTVIGQSKYCIPYPLSLRLISLRISLFDFNSIIKKDLRTFKDE